MKTKQFFFAALAATALASCSSDDYIAEAPPVNADDGLSPIVFSSLGRGMTRADFEGAEAAGKLGKKFVVFGYKGATTGTPGSTVFDNYLVEYGENTANTTESNTNNWEYVGKTPIDHATANGITKQTIKYWDYSQAQYDFIAWSTGSKEAIYSGTPTTGQVLVSAIEATAATAPATGLAKGYTFEGAAADLAECYISDLVTVNKTGTAGVGEVTGYNQPVTLKFRQLGTKVRLGIYETVPGYSVKDVKFYRAAATNLPSSSPQRATLFTTTPRAIRTAGTYTVYFPTVDEPSNADNNQAHITFAAAASSGVTILSNGTLNYTIAESGEKTTGARFLGRSSNTATFAGNEEDNFYTILLPNEDGVNLNLRVDYTLESIDGSGETIEVKGATAQVPSIYTKWLPGYAYTYLFKISDKTNGYTGAYDPTKPDDITTNSDPAGLYPITFDACVVNAEDGDKTQETITTVSAPSITTYQSGSNVVNNNEYTVLTADASKGISGDIYVTVNDGNTDNTPDLANGALQDLTGKAALYTIPAGKTEAEVIDALQLQDDDATAGTIKGRNGVVLTTATGDNALSLTNEVQYGVDVNVITIPEDGTKKKAAKFTPAASTTYAFVYTKTAQTSTTDKFEAKTFAAEAAVKGYYRYALTSAGTGDAQKDVLYFANSDASTGKLTPFIGQGVSNLYLDNTGTTIATGNAKTGTTYYYTTNGGQTYKEAHNVTYVDFASATLYTDAEATVPKTETTPTDGTAYYWKDGDGKIFYCVILPQQVDSWYIIDDTANKVACGDSDKAVTGMTYFDKYTQNDGVYYAKVIKVQ
ncbi:MAG: hypothetical protein IJ841_12080 [Prevotella sp.]|nr:hypothetical protein [Prevotella sp.]